MGRGIAFMQRAKPANLGLKISNPAIVALLQEVEFVVILLFTPGMLCKAGCSAREHGDC